MFGKNLAHITAEWATSICVCPFFLIHISSETLIPECAQSWSSLATFQYFFPTFSISGCMGLVRKQLHIKGIIAACAIRP